MFAKATSYLHKKCIPLELTEYRDNPVVAIRL
jgi:hypothetical protein